MMVKLDMTGCIICGGNIKEKRGLKWKYDKQIRRYKTCSSKCSKRYVRIAKTVLANQIYQTKKQIRLIAELRKKVIELRKTKRGKTSSKTIRRLK